MKFEFGNINRVKYSINDIITNGLDTNNIKDDENNDLTLCNGPIKNPYLRRTNIHGCHSVLSEWHEEWQSHFGDKCEVKFDKIERQLKNRRTDVDLNDKQVIEFQNSNISLKEVNNRKSDYKLHNKEIIWVINGNKSTEINKLNNSGRIFLEFTKKAWKYESFIEYDYIYIDIKEQIYRICPKLVKSMMIDIPKPINKSEFIKGLVNNDLYCKFENSEVPQTNIYVKQQGAGNGKTWGIIQLLKDSKFSHYDTFIYLTKQHSAVHVIYDEIKDQKERGELSGIKFIDLESPINNKKHIFEFTNNINDKSKKVIIGTVDSFVYALANTNCSGTNKFVAMAETIIDEELKCSRNGSVTYARNDIKLNKKLLLIGDEMQDLHETYMKAIIRITRDRYVDFYAVGDKLQSICIEKNAFNYLANDFQSNVINVHRYVGTNICRRFKNKRLLILLII